MEKLPISLRNGINKEYIIGIIKFGSSVGGKKYNDIDLAVIIKKNCYFKFLKLINPEDFKNFDISLIREEEIKNLNKFRFGSHGQHLIPVFQKGDLLFGKNPFLNFVVDDELIRHSILMRLYDYVYDVRKSFFKKEIMENIERRWHKFVRLSLYLISEELNFLDVLKISESEVGLLLRKYNITIDNENILIAYEKVWEKVPK